MIGAIYVPAYGYGRVDAPLGSIGFTYLAFEKDAHECVTCQACIFFCSLNGLSLFVKQVVVVKQASQLAVRPIQCPIVNLRISGVWTVDGDMELLQCCGCFSHVVVAAAQ